MNWVLLIFFCFLGAFFLYFQRFSDRRGWRGQNLVQWYYGLVAVVSGFSLFKIVNQILSRPSTDVTPADSKLLISLGLAIFLILISTIFHSISLLWKKPLSRRSQKLLELIHGPLSHNCIYLSGIGITVLVAMLDLAYPQSDMSSSPLTLSSLGIGIGSIGAISIIWSEYVLIPLLSSYVASLFLLREVETMSLVQLHPFAGVALVSIFFIAVSLSIFTASKYITGNKIYRKLQRLYPVGHPRRISKLTS